MACDLTPELLDAGIAEDPGRVAALDRDLADLAERHQRAAGSTAMEWEYLLLTARKRS